MYVIGWLAQHSVNELHGLSMRRGNRCDFIGFVSSQFSFNWDLFMTLQKKWDLNFK